MNNITKLALRMLLYTDVNANRFKKKKNICRVPEGQSSQCGKRLLRQNNRLFKMSGCPLEEETVE